MFKATHTSNMTVFLTIWQSNKKISCVKRIKQKHIHLLKLKLGFAMVFFLFASLDDRYVQLCLLWVLCVIRQLSVSLSVLSFHCLSVSQLSLHCLSVSITMRWSWCTDLFIYIMCYDCKFIFFSKTFLNV